MYIVYSLVINNLFVFFFSQENVDQQLCTLSLGLIQAYAKKNIGTMNTDVALLHVQYVVVPYLPT